jgi:hypothetical protein
MQPSWRQRRACSAQRWSCLGRCSLAVACGALRNDANGRGVSRARHVPLLPRAHAEVVCVRVRRVDVLQTASCGGEKGCEGVYVCATGQRVTRQITVGQMNEGWQWA